MIPLDGGDFRLSVLGGQVVECLGHQILNGGLALNCQGTELPSHVRREMGSDLLGAHARPCSAMSNSLLRGNSGEWLGRHASYAAGCCGNRR